MANENVDANDLICEIAKKAEGVGPGKGYALAEDFDGDYPSFREACLARLLAIQITSGKHLLTNLQAKAIVAEKNMIPAGYQLREAWVFWIGREFLRNQVVRLSELNIDSLDINPLLVKTLDLKDARQILEFNLYQNVTRSVVTAWGTTVEELLIRCGAERFSGSSGGRAGRRPDMQKAKGGKVYLLQVKSGPNTMNVDMVLSLNELIVEYRKADPKKRVLLGMTYGRPERISSQIRDNLDDFENTALIGRELWDFVSDEKGFHRKVFELLDKSSAGVLEKPFSDLFWDRLDELYVEWAARFRGMSIGEILEHYI